jgi:hypothetical protein
MKNIIRSTIGGLVRPRPIRGLRKLVGLVTLTLLIAPGHAAQGRAWILDPQDLPDSSGDIRSVSAHVLGEHLHLSMTVHGAAAPATEQTPEGKANRYYYHWLLDTDNNPATGRSNAEYEGNPTGVTTPIGAERVVMIAWRDGKPGNVHVYDPLDEDTILIDGFEYKVGGNTLTAVIPLADLGLVAGQTIALAAFQEGASDGWLVDWTESATLTLTGLNVAQAVVTDEQDLPDSSGDIRAISAHVLGDHLHLSMSVQGAAAPAIEQTPDGKVNRYYYHWLLDTDNNPATGRSNAEYEGNPTGVTTPIGAERVVMIAWRDGKPGNIEVYDPLDEDTILVEGFAYQSSGNTLSAMIPLADLGLVAGQTIALAAFQEGASDGWLVDWTESTTLTLTGPAVSQARVTDPQDLPDSSGDIRAISAHVEGSDLHLSMTVHGAAAPSMEQTPDGKANRYYYHWLLDTDNNPATGRSNAEYEGNPTGLTTPIGAERVIMIAWRDGKPGNIQVYDPLDEDTILVDGFAYQASGNTLTAVIPLVDLDLVAGQTIGLAAFQEGASDGWLVDWTESQVVTLDPPSQGRMAIDGDFADWEEADAAGVVASVEDPEDMLDPNGDIRQIQASVEDGYLYLRMAVHGAALPSMDETPAPWVNRYYYHWLLDTDNNPATGRSNAEYEGNPTGVTTPIGTERVIMIGWRDGNPNGIRVYDPLDEDSALVEDFEYAADGDSVEARIRLADLGLVPGQTIAMSAFQEGASDGWSVDWAESVVLTLVEGGPGGMTLPALFTGNAYGYEIQIEDDGELEVDPSSITVRMDGQELQATVTKNGAVTSISGQHPNLLEAETAHTVSLSLQAGATTQSKDFVFTVAPYTVLPTANRLPSLDTSNVGFQARVTMIGSQEAGQGGRHGNTAAAAETQLVGGLINEVTGLPYFNEADQDWDQWAVTPEVIEGVVNWYEHAGAQDASLNFPNDEQFPQLWQFGLTPAGVVIEVRAYLELEEGFHQVGLYTEGGHKITAGLGPLDPVLSLFDNSEIERVPSYFARNQFIDVVAPVTGYYPIRVLWFQDSSSQEDGLMLELFSVKDRELHLLNDAANPKSIRAYRAGALLGIVPETPSLLMQREGNELVLQWTGMLQVANEIGGEWSDYADQAESPMRLPLETSSATFMRSRSY